MIVVDSSVWIANLQDRPTSQAALLRELAGRETLVVGDLILAEVLQGARDEAHARRLERELRQHAVLSMVGEDVAVEAARNYRTMRRAGLTPRRRVDVLIGTFCLVRNWPLLHHDRDFDAMERLLGLAVVRAVPGEPPVH